MQRFFEAQGVVHNKEIGDVTLDKRGSHNLIGHNNRLSGKMRSSIAAIPSVIAHGNVVSNIENYKNRGSNNIVLVAPIEIKNNTKSRNMNRDIYDLYYMAVAINDVGEIKQYWNHKVREKKNSDMQTRLHKELTGKTQSLSSTETVSQPNTKSQDVLKMAAAVNEDDTNTESSNIGKELNRGAFVNFDNVESNGKTEIARKSKVTGIARKLLPEEGNGSIHDLVIGIQRLFKVPVFFKGRS